MRGKQRKAEEVKWGTEDNNKKKQSEGKGRKGKKAERKKESSNEDRKG